MRYGLFRGGCGKHPSGVVYEIGLLLGCHQFVEFHYLRAINASIVEKLWCASEELIHTYFEKVGKLAKRFKRRLAISLFITSVSCSSQTASKSHFSLE